MVKSVVAGVTHFIHAHFIWLLLGSYVVAGVFPKVGLRLREVSLGTTKLPVLMLGFLLINAGLGVEVSELKQLWKRPGGLALGLIANLVIPIGFIWGVAHTMQFWHNPDEVQNILVGLALVASMPIAGSSTAWSQNASGNLALSLGLVLSSTLLSPLTTPVALHSVGLMTSGDYSEDLHELADSGTGSFLTYAVIVPSLLGIAARMLLGKERTTRIRPYLKLSNAVVLLFLNYSNAAISLPQSVANPDLDFLAVTLAITLGLCVAAFSAGWLIGWRGKFDEAEQISLTFGLGMNNNGTGLVLASMALADHPHVLLPIIFYNLVQHLVAGITNANWPRLRKLQISLSTSGQTPGRRGILRRLLNFSVMRAGRWTP
jgi:BASS family bile acid:Na+ symporter